MLTKIKTSFSKYQQCIKNLHWFSYTTKSLLTIFFYRHNDQHLINCNNFSLGIWIGVTFDKLKRENLERFHLNEKAWFWCNGIKYFTMIRVLLVLFCPNIWDALHELVPFIQFKNHKKNTWRSVNLLKIVQIVLKIVQIVQIVPKGAKHHI